MNTSEGQKREITLTNGRKITFTYYVKQVKNINLRVKSNLDVVVSINSVVTLKELDRFILNKSDFINKSLNKFEEILKYSPKPKEFVSGESFKILGKDLRLKVIEDKMESVDTDGIYLFLHVSDKSDFNHKKELVDMWINNLCLKEYGEICKKTFRIFRKYGVTYPQIRIREMISRWGSCQPKRGIITLNTMLIEAPRNCIEYVILHEFCHFIHPNHSKDFYRCLQMLMPDWKERKRVLESQEYYFGELIEE